ncbi:hypothetical protein ABTY61_25465 [Kitasatospora sp. NPDC096128]|uniref:hypothetical protein n=1 Tax=Kitasatospora sp. NPDC096128 TaxID=3155547 RepID=UPI00331B2FB0
MPTRQLRDEPPPTVPSPDPAAASREPVLLGEVLFHTLAELARRTPDQPPAFPAQRTRPHP